MRWACILLPQLAMDAVLRHCEHPLLPRVLVEGGAQRRTLKSANTAAIALGLKAGLPLATAQAIAQGFHCHPYDPNEETRAHELLAAWAYRFSSQVSLHYPQALMVEIEGSLGLFGPWPLFQARLREELAGLGFRHRIVMAPHPVAARALVNVHDDIAIDDAQLRTVLGRLPIAKAGFGKAVAQSLSRMGVRTLQQLLALPRAGVAKRFPPSVLQHLDALLGEGAFPLPAYQPPDVFTQRLELGYEVESSQALLFPLRRLSADLAAFLAGRDGSVQRFTLHFEHEDHPPTLLEVGLLAAERDPAMLFEITRTRLEHLRLPAPVRAVLLHADQLPAFVPVHRELFDARPQQNTPWQQLRERLRARLGDEAVHGISVHADHRPEQAWRPEQAGKPCTGVHADSLRPGWLLPTPQPWTGAPPQMLAGPERIESGWWDGADIRRDYYQVQTRLGQQAWVWRDVGKDNPWMLHGWFA
jgi:protein ImuB